MNQKTSVKTTSSPQKAPTIPARRYDHRQITLRLYLQQTHDLVSFIFFFSPVGAPPYPTGGPSHLGNQKGWPTRQEFISDTEAHVDSVHIDSGVNIQYNLRIPCAKEAA